MAVIAALGALYLDQGITETWTTFACIFLITGTAGSLIIKMKMMLVELSHSSTKEREND